MKLIELTDEIIELDFGTSIVSGRIHATVSGRVRHCGTPGQSGEALWVGPLCVPVTAEVTRIKGAYVRYALVTE